MKLVQSVVALALLGRQPCIAEIPDWHERGEAAMLPCPLGSYRDSNLGARLDGCVLCPPGTYGSSKNIAGDLWREYQKRRMKREQQ